MRRSVRLPSACSARSASRLTWKRKPEGKHFPLIQNKETDFYMLGWGVPTFDSEYIFNFLVTRPPTSTAPGTTPAIPIRKSTRMIVLASETDQEVRNATIANIWAHGEGGCALHADPQPGAELGHAREHQLPGAAGRSAAL
jgi:hypothetical protein